MTGTSAPGTPTRPPSARRSPILCGVILAGTLIACALLSCQRSSDTQYISIGTGGTGGVYYPYGGGLAEIWSRNLPGIKAVAEVTAASVENVKLAHRGETVIAEIMGDVAYQAYHGTGKFDGDPQKILALAVMYPNILQIVTHAGSGVQGMADLRDRTVSLGAPGSGTAFMCDLLLDALAIDKEDMSVRRLSFVENANALRDRTIDVGIWAVAPPTSSIMDLATTHAIHLVGLSTAEQTKIIERYPFYSAYELAADLYRGVDDAVPTISVWNVIICTADLPAELVYDLTRVLFENNEYLQRIHPFARHTTPGNTLRHSPIPLHPGARRYLEEQGLHVPEALRAHE